MTQTMNRTSYDAIDRLNWSRLKVLNQSPAHYQYALTHPREDTDSMKRGRAVHAAVFEPMQFARRFVCWSGGRRAGGKWEAFKADHADKEILTAEAWEECERIQEAVRGDPVAAPYLSGGKGEQTITWTLEIPALSDFPAQRWECKGRLDFVTPTAIVDLKTARDASQSGFGRDCLRYGYHAAAAWYADGFARATGKDLPFVFVVVEAKAPHVVTVQRLPEKYLELGRQHVRGLLNRLDWCTRENSWPGYSDAEIEVTLPAWVLPEDDEDATGLDLEIGEHDAA